MYRLFLTLIIGVYSFHFLSAQTEVGIKIGYSNAWVDFLDFPPPLGVETAMHGISIHSSIRHPLTKRLSISIEPGYIQRGSGYLPAIISDTEKAEQKSHYFELPLFLQIEKPVINQVGIVGKLGYSIARLLGSNRTLYSSDPQQPPQTVKLNSCSPYPINKWDHGLHTGFGIFHVVSFGRFQIEGDYYFGAKDSISDLASKNKNINFSLSFTRFL